MTGPARSRMVVRRYQKQATKTELPGKAQAPEEKAPPDSEADREPESDAPPGKERASGSSQPMQTDEPQDSPGTGAVKQSAVKAKQKKPRSIRPKQRLARAAICRLPSPPFKEGRGASRPDDQDEDDKEGEGITLKEGPGATRPTEAEADEAEVGGPEGARPRAEDDKAAHASQECALWHVSKRSNSLTTPSLSR